MPDNDVHDQDQSSHQVFVRNVNKKTLSFFSSQKHPILADSCKKGFSAH